jgi:nitrate reductase NapE component
MTNRGWNWHLWLGFLVCLAGVVSYPLFFDKYPATRDVPWINFLLLAAGIFLLLVGLRHAYADAEHYRGKISGPVLAVLSLVFVGSFGYAIFYMTRQLPASAGAPRVGQSAPGFELKNTNDLPVSLAGLLSTPLPATGAPPKGVLLIFYRGYW